MDALVPVRHVVSRNFTGYDDWINLGSPGLCCACTWSYRSPLLRTLPHLVVRWPELLTPLDHAGLTALLSAPVSDTTVVVVPLRPGRKHLLSGAAWGRVVTEDALLSWTSADVARLRHTQQLHRAGFSGRQLLQPAPPYKVMKTLPGKAMEKALHAWAELEPWRRRPAWLQVAWKATTGRTLR